MVFFYCRAMPARGVAAGKVGAGATIAFMAKFKPAKAKKPSVPAPQGAIPCVVLVILAIAGVMLLLFFVMKSSSGS
jgi:multisubunit Na+/H+ antiporter MnhB subunit